MRKRMDTTTVESPDSGIMDMSNYGFSPAFSKPARNLSFEVERRSAGLEEGGEGGDTTANSSSFYSTASSPAIAASSEAASAADFSPLDHIRDRILGVGHGRRAAGGKRRRTALFDSTSPKIGLVLPDSSAARAAAPFLVVVVVLASAAFAAVTLAGLLNRDGGLWRTSDPAMNDLNGKYASMQFAHKARAKRLAEEGRLMPEDATVDEDGVQLGGKRAAILYAHRLRQAEAEAAAEAAKAAPPVADAEEEGVAVKADAEAEGGEEKAVNDVGDMDLKRTLEEIKRLQAEANSLKRENIQLKIAENVGGEEEKDEYDEEEEEKPKKPKKAKRSPKSPRRRNNPFRKTSAGGAGSSSREERAADAGAGEDDPFRYV